MLPWKPAGNAIGEAGYPQRPIGDVCALIDATPKPTVAVIQGACIGGALALASCCDVMIASHGAFFSVPEVRLGFAPGPLVEVFTRAIGPRALRRYLLSGERFYAEEALRLGLVHQLCDAAKIDKSNTNIEIGDAPVAKADADTIVTYLLGEK